MEFIKKNFAILLAFALPVVLIAVVALSTYLPSRFLSTSYNFLYSACTDGVNYYSYNCDRYLQQRYQVQEGKLAILPLDPKQDLNSNSVPDINEKYYERLFLHDTQKNESREITQDEAKALTLSGLLTSPDGVIVSGSYSGGGDFFPFGGRSSTYGYYLTHGKAKSKLNLINNSDQYYYGNNFQFVGWVLPGRN